MAKEDEGGWENRLLMVGHNEVVALVLPHQIRNGLDLQVNITGDKKNRNEIDYAVENKANDYPASSWKLGQIGHQDVSLLEEGDEKVDH